MNKLLLSIVTVFFTVITILTIPLLLGFFVIPLILYRWILSKLHKHFHGTSGGILSPETTAYCPLVRDESSTSGAWIYSNYNKMLVMLAVTLKCPTLEIDAFRELVTRELILAKQTGSELLLYPELQQYPNLWMGYLFWEQDSSFFIENHIKLYQNAEDWNVRNSLFVQDFVHTYTSEILPRDRSPWEVTVIENVQETTCSEPRTLIVFKFAHYMADGYSIFHAITRLADGGRESVTRHEPPPPGKCTQVLTYLMYPMVGPYLLVSQMFHREGQSEFIRNGNELPSPYRRTSIISSRLDFEDVKNAARRAQVSFSTFVLFAFGWGTGKYLGRYANHKPEENPTHLRCLLPLAVPSHARGLTNDIYIASVNIPLHNIDFEQQLREFERKLAKIKHSPGVLTWKLLRSGLGLMPSAWTWKYKMMNVVPLINTHLSIFPGPKKEFKILGKRVVGMNFCSPNSSHSLNTPYQPFQFNILTYNGTFQFWLTAEPDIVTQDQICDLAGYIEAEFTSTSQTAHGKSKGRKRSGTGLMP